LYSTGVAAHGTEEKQARCLGHTGVVVRVALLDNFPYQDYGFEANIFQTRSADCSTKQKRRQHCLVYLYFAARPQAHRLCKIAFVNILYIDDCGIQTSLR
jgi:hypothetical protein